MHVYICTFYMLIHKYISTGAADMPLIDLYLNATTSYPPTVYTFPSIDFYTLDDCESLGFNNASNEEQ